MLSGKKRNVYKSKSQSKGSDLLLSGRLLHTALNFSRNKSRHLQFQGEESVKSRGKKKKI